MTRTGTCESPASWAARISAFAGDDLKATVLRADENRLDNAVLGDALGERRQFFWIVILSRLKRIRFEVDQRQRLGFGRRRGKQSAFLAAFFEIAEEGLQAASKFPFRHRAVSEKNASNPRPVRSIASVRGRCKREQTNSSW